MKRILVIGIATLALAGCGGSSYGGSSSNSSSAGTDSSAASAAGLTDYMFSKDTPGKSNCSGACAQNWPPATSASGLSGKITHIKRSDGSMQIALNGHPLYHFSGDKKPGDTNGDGLTAFGGTWTKAGSSSSSSNSSSGASSSQGAYGY